MMKFDFQQKGKSMKEKEIFEQFLETSNIPKEDVIDYRYCTKFYAGIYIEDAIIIQLSKKYEHNHIIYKANNIGNVCKELSESMGNNTQFKQGFQEALNEVKSYGRQIEHNET